MTAKERTNISRTSVLPAPAEEVFSRLKLLSTLRFVAYPYATFAPAGTDAASWEEGGTYRFYFRLFAVLPLGVHTVEVVEMDTDCYRICTVESNRFVPVWNHRITLEPLSEQTVRYTDEVEMDAGWKTPFVRLWAKCFYAHRQRRWLKLLDH